MTRPESKFALSGAPRRLLAAAAIALPLAACGGGLDRITYLATTGEAPADGTRYVDVTGRDRLGRAPPALPGTRYAPEPVPGAGKKDEKASVAQIGETVEGLTAAYANTRKALSDIDELYQLRRQSLRLYTREYLVATRKVNLQHGDPLPKDDTALSAAVVEMRSAIALMRGDLLKMHNLLVRLDGAGLGALALSRRVAATKPEAPGDAKRIADLKAALDKSIANARKLAIEGRTEVGAYVEYLSGQETTIGKLEDQLKNAKSAAK